MSEQEKPIQNEEIEEPIEATAENLEDEVDEVPVSTPEEGTITFKRSHLYAVLLPLAFVAGLAFGYIFWGRDLSSETGQTAVAVVPQEENPPAAPANLGEAEPTPEFRRYDVPEDDDPVWGSPDAPITIIEFSDYECPYCRKWHVEVWPELQAAYGDQIRLVYRDFPLVSIHANANSAAAAANCAGEQDMYWPFSEKLFEMSLSLGRSTYQTYAEELGLDLDEFNECLESGRNLAEVEADYEYAANLGIRSTPTFFINGIPVVGAQPFEVFKTVIEKELAGEFPQ
ncbi:DsbA family protein [Chloroflexota bacterium]